MHQHRRVVFSHAVNAWRIMFRAVARRFVAAVVLLLLVGVLAVSWSAAWPPPDAKQPAHKQPDKVAAERRSVFVPEHQPAAAAGDGVGIDKSGPLSVADLCCSTQSPWRCVTGNEPSAIGLAGRASVPGNSERDATGVGAGPNAQPPRRRALRIGFVTYATGPYNSFVEELWESVQLHAFPGEDVHLFIFTDRANDKYFLPGSTVHKRQQERLGWPFDSLGRHFLYLNASDWFDGMDYLLAIDSDAKVVGRLDVAMLGDRIATLQAWSFGRERALYTYEQRLTPARTPYSSAFIGPDEGLCYFCGGLFGGTVAGFLSIVEASVALARRDLAGVPSRVALWHDESYLNRVFLDAPPSVVLSPAFMYPEPPVDEWLTMQDSKQGAAAWLAHGGTGRRFPHKIYNLGVRKHRSQEVDKFQPLSATLPAIMSPRGTAVHFPLPQPMSRVATQVTFVVKAFERPTCVRRLLRSAAAVYPGIQLILLDDSTSPVITVAELAEYDLRITYLRTEPDIGLSDGRNRLVDAVRTPYVLLLDDDFVLPEDRSSDGGRPGGKLAALMAALEDGGFDIAGGCADSKQGSAWSYSLARFGGVLRQSPDVPCAAAEPMPRPPDYAAVDAACWRVDLVLNFYLARVSFLRQVRWDPALKLGEHEDFFLRVKDAGGRVAMCRGLVAETDNTCDAAPAYKAQRRRVFDFWVHMFKKHHLTQMVTAAGAYTLVCNGADGAEKDCSIDVKQESIWFT